MSRALVLAGGGLAGVAWETGVVAGLADAGVDLAGADLVVGTSAGSVVAANLRSGTDPAELLAGQIDPAKQSTEMVSPVSFDECLKIFDELALMYPDPDELRREICARAVAPHPVEEKRRQAAVASRLVSPDWPAADLRIVAVDGGTAERVVFTSSDGVAIADAVAASCAVPLVWPSVRIGARRYVDGGVFSNANADLAADHDQVLILYPTVGVPDPQLEAQIRGLERGGAQVLLLQPDDATMEAIGADPLDPAVRGPVGNAGADQAEALAEEVRAFWND